MAGFENQDSKSGFSMKVWRGERMCLAGFDVDAPEPDLVGFAIEVKEPGAPDFVPLRNRLTFASANGQVNGDRKFLSTEAPFQKFRWIHFPFEPKPGVYTYRGTKMHMPTDNVLKKGTSIDLDISLAQTTFDGFLDVGFTRNFASSQAFREKFNNPPNIDAIGAQIIPASADAGLSFKKMPGDIYDWLGFEAFDLIFGFLDQAVADPSITLDIFAYDFNEPDMLQRLEKLGPRLRAIIDDSTETKNGVTKGHGVATSAESKASKRLRASAGSSHVKRTHFKNLQHHKVFIARRNGKAFKVLVGSTNFSFRGIYIQSNNVLVFDDPDIAGLYGKVFDAAFADPSDFSSDPLAGKWHLMQANGRPPIHFAFSPHADSDLTLNPVRGAIDQASSSVLYAVAFLNLIKSGPTKEAFDRLLKRPIFSYGISDETGGMEIRKPDGSVGLVDFAFLAKNAPQPFKAEWSGGKGINVHHKFVVTDFNLPTAKVFTGSSNLSPSGEQKNGDHLIMIEDRKVAIAYAIEALRVFDHLHFRLRMQDAKVGKTKGTKKKAAKPTTPTSLTLAKPKAISGKPAWFDRFYVAGSQKERDRKLFSR
jgi:hypothetical protein